MYAKLVLSANTTPAVAMRDIIRLCTSQSPSTANLEGFSQTNSVIVDSTPAGWSYVLGTECFIANSAPINIKFTSANTNGPPIGATVNTANVIEQHTISAPCLSPMDNVLKYACLTSYSNCALTAAAAAPGRTNYYLTGAASVNTSTGVVTGESYRPFHSSSGAPYDRQGYTYSGNTMHLIATARHITLISEAKAADQCGVRAVWECSQSEADLFYNSVPMVSYCYANSVAGITTFTGAPTATASGDDHGAYVHNYTRPSTGVNASLQAISVINPFMFIHQNGDNATASRTNYAARSTGSSSTGLTRHFATPILFHSMDIGLPIKFVTGTVPIYMMKGGTATTGDTVTINGVDYTYFEVIPAVGTSAGSYTKPLAFAMLTY